MKLFENLKKAVQNQKLPHALLFVGDEGAVQKETALKLAACLFCDNLSGSDSCGACAQCHLLAKDSHPDFVTIGSDLEAATIGIEEVRDLIAKANLKPFQARAKIFYIESAARLNDVSQNALLKTLEEPPSHTYFVMSVKDSSQLLETVRSRAQSVYFTSGNIQAAANQKSVNLSGQIVRYILNDLASPVVSPELSGFERGEIAAALDRTVEYFRHILLMRVGADEIVGSVEDEGLKRRISESFSEEDWLDLIERLAQAKEEIAEGMANAKIVFSVLWDDLRRAKTHVR